MGSPASYGGKGTVQTPPASVPATVAQRYTPPTPAPASAWPTPPSPAPNYALGGLMPFFNLLGGSYLGGKGTTPVNSPSSANLLNYAYNPTTVPGMLAPIAPRPAPPPVAAPAPTPAPTPAPYDPALGMGG